VKLVCIFERLEPGGEEPLPLYIDGGGASADGGMAKAVSNWVMIGVGFHWTSGALVGCCW
jgi:hypothetical protein